MTFVYPHLLYLLLLVPALFGLWLLDRYLRRRRLARYGHPGELQHLMPDASRYKPGIKITLRLLALAALVLAVARPVAGAKEEVESTRGIEVMIAVDVSRSMLASASDDPRGISRLQRAKFLLGRLIDRLDNDKVGLIVFAGDAITQLPMTTDFVSARIYLDELSTNMVTSQGTAIGSALNMAVNSFTPDKEGVSRAIILITDGENHEGDAVEMARYAKSLGIEVDIIGIGTPKGAPIPLDASRGIFLQDDSGTPVTTCLNEGMAKEIAAAADGVYINGSGSKAVDQLMAQLDKLKKSDLSHVAFKASAEQFPVFAWIALGLLIIDMLVTPRKSQWLKKYTFFTKK